TCPAPSRPPTLSLHDALPILTDPTTTAEKLRPYARVEGKPVLACWMGGNSVAAGEAILNQAGIPTFPYPDTAAKVFHEMWRSTRSEEHTSELQSLAYLVCRLL